jgi:opacity protein-like surface antigen
LHALCAFLSGDSMRVRSCLLSALILLAPLTAFAQPQVPKAEVFAGYSILPANGDDFPRGTSHGFQLTASGNLNRWFALFAELGMHFDTNSDLGPGFAGIVAETRVTQFLAGPRFIARGDHVSTFAHGLIGNVRGDAGEAFSGFSDTELAFGGGAGVDIDLTRRLAVRSQFDVLGSFADIVEGNTRFAIGLVTKFGGP